MIVIDELIPLLHERLSAIEPTIAFVGRQLTRQQLIDSDAHALFVRSTTRVDADLLRGTNVRFVGTASAGTDHVDIGWLAYQDIEFASAPGSNAWAVVEYVYGWIAKFQIPTSSTIGVIGHGNIGMRLDNVLKAFGYQTLIYDPPKYGHTRSDLLTLLDHSDVVSLHVPLTHNTPHSTIGLIDEALVNRMRQNALLIQTSRGGVLADQAVVRRVHDGSLRAVFDVYAAEPTVPSELVAAIQHCTPHIAGHSIDAKLRGASMVADAYLEFVRANRIVGLSQPVSPAINDITVPSHLEVPLTVRNVHAEAQWFVQAYTANPGPASFDQLRRMYEPKKETLRTMLGVDG